jgi:hypothetical protein
MTASRTLQPAEEAVMIALGMLVLLALVGAGAYGVVHTLEGRGAPTPRPAGDEPSTEVPTGLAAELTGWVADGLLSQEQATAILAHERGRLRPERAAPPARPARNLPSVAEALGYLGGMLALAGLVLLVSRYWPDLSTGGRLAISGGAAVLLLAGGELVREPRDAALERLRAVLWLAAVAATGVFTVVLVRQAADAEAMETVVLATSAAVGLESGLLWRGRHLPVQQLTTLGAVPVFLGAAVAEVADLPGPSGAAVWTAGAVLLWLGVRRYLPSPHLTELVGVLALAVGAIMMANDWTAVGTLGLLATAFGVMALALVPGLTPDRSDHLLLGVLGVPLLLMAVPSTLGYFAQDAAGATGLVTYVVGAGLVLVGAQGLVRLATVVEALGALTLLGGAALLWTQWHGVAPVVALVTSVALIGLGMLPDQLVLSFVGSLGLLVNVPWAITWFFPGEGRVPLLTLVSGLLILALAVLLTRLRDRALRNRLRHP